MAKENLENLLKEQLSILDSATSVLQESYARVQAIFDQKIKKLSVAQRESCEALTARFARLCDFLFQRIFRTIDQIELVDEGTALDRLNRMEKRGVIESAHEWRVMRDLRNDIVHEYLIDSSDDVLKEAYQYAPKLVDTVLRFKEYLVSKGYGLK